MTTANQIESFEEIYAKEGRLSREIEKIEIAYAKIAEKYGEYSDCKSFAEFLRTIEKVFLEAKFRNWDSEKSKNELIKTKIKTIAATGSVGEDVLSVIYDDFKKSGATIGKIYEITAQLLEKYGQDRECAELILYIQYLFVNFHESEKRSERTDELKDRLIQARMEVLSSDGNPELIVLQKIYQEFKQMIG